MQRQEKKERSVPGGSKRIKQQGFSSFASFLLIIGIFFITSLAFAGLSGSLAEKQILLRIQPEGEVTVEVGAEGQSGSPVKPAAVTDIGQQRYEEVCHICHEKGLAGAPKFGDKADWAPRIAEGIDTLVKHAIQGYKAMPPKGTCTNCSDEEIKKAVEYMVLNAK